MARCPHPLAADHFATRNPELVAALDQFAYRFAKLQDTMSVQLFRRFALDALHEPVESLARRLADLGAHVTWVDRLIPEYDSNLFNIARRPPREGVAYGHANQYTG